MSKNCSKIRKLSYQEALKIAAGQVVERPANIVKELVENALDAGANKIEIHIEDGGKKKIRVIDNGSGMNESDAQLCFEKHTTSKITKLDDLVSIQTYGFRGEALASIAAVSKITLLTKETNAVNGYSITTQSDGSLSNPTLVGCPEGTDLSVEDLFYGLPARKKFLKARETEWRHILNCMHAFCLSYPLIQFKLLHDDTLVLHAPITTTIIKRAAALFDASLHTHILPIQEYNSHNITISGYISAPSYERYDKNLIFCLVNKRPVKNFQLTQALVKGYQNVLQPGKFPVGFLEITIPGEHVDINMHPRKEEVKFEHPLQVQRAIETAVRATLEQHVSDTLGTSVALKKVNDSINFTPSTIPISYAQKSSSFMPFDFDSYVNTQSHSKSPKYTFSQHLKETPYEQTHSFEQETISIIGNYKNTYIMIDHENGLLFIDQHAAHERILYERLKSNQQHCQQKHIGHIISVSQEELTTFIEYKNNFIATGFSIEQFAKDQLLVQASPLALKASDVTAIIKEMLGKKEITDSFSHALLARTACAQAVKAGDQLTYEKMNEIVTDLKKTNNRMTCPHGRPTFWLLPIHEIIKKFKRDYKSHKSQQFPLE